MAVIVCCSSLLKMANVFHFPRSSLPPTVSLALRLWKVALNAVCSRELCLVRPSRVNADESKLILLAALHAMEMSGSVASQAHLCMCKHRTTTIHVSSYHHTNHALPKRTTTQWIRAVLRHMEVFYSRLNSGTSGPA